MPVFYLDPFKENGNTKFLVSKTWIFVVAAVFFFFLAEPWGLRDLNSLTRDWTLAMAVKVLTTGLPGNSLRNELEMWFTCANPWAIKEIIKGQI